MSNETARLAREWAERAKNSKYFDEYADDAAAAVELVLATTAPLTMADVAWDDEKHHLGGATLPNGEEAVMVWPTAYTTDYIITNQGEWRRDQLTPNGKRYELREVGAPEQPTHPETLVTEQDYENAPAGTVVATPRGSAWTQGPDGNWWQGAGWKTGYEMAGTERQVLRKGWGK